MHVLFQRMLWRGEQSPNQDQVTLVCPRAPDFGGCKTPAGELGKVRRKKNGMHFVLLAPTAKLLVKVLEGGKMLKRYSLKRQADLTFSKTRVSEPASIRSLLCVDSNYLSVWRHVGHLPRWSTVQMIHHGSFEKDITSSKCSAKALLWPVYP